MQFFVVMPVHNRLEQTIRAIECLHRQSCTSKITLVVVDDGSTDGTCKAINERYGDRLNLRILEGDGNLWWGGAMRLGVEWVLNHLDDPAGNVIAMMNNDVTFDATLIERAEFWISQNPKTILGSLVQDERDRKTYYSGGRMVSWPLALTYWPFVGTVVDETIENPELVDVDFLGAEATFVPAEVYRVAGNINSRWLPHYHSDSEFTNRAKRAGYRVAICPSLIVRKTIETTAKFNNFTVRERWRDLIPSMFARRSANNIKDRIFFAFFACPKIWLPFYLVADLSKLLLRVIAVPIFGSRLLGLKLWLNDVIGNGA